MITPTEIKKKAQRLYLPYLSAYLRDEAFFPKTIPFRKPKASEEYLTLRKGVEQLLQGSKRQLGYGYMVVLQTRNHRRYGTQSLPASIQIENEADLLKLLRKSKEAAAFKKAAALTKQEIPSLMTWLAKKPHRALKHLDEWHNLLRVCRYFMQHPRPNLYLRELPIPVHTKFIEEHKGILKELLDELLPADAIQQDETDFEKRFFLRYDEPLIRIRLLDEALQAQYGFPTTDFSAPLSQFSALNLPAHRFIITENKMTFLALPPLANTFALFGRGFGVGALKEVTWLRDCELIYWGDLDAQGFAILSQLRSSFPQAISLMMDDATWHAFKHFAVAGKPSRIEQLPNLTPAEHQLFAYLAEKTLRLEQERISHAFAMQHLSSLNSIPG